MKRLPFYKIDATSYLYRENLRCVEGKYGPEEEVRQWCAFELIRAYGFELGRLEFERHVKVGSKDYKIDIAVLKENRPWIVVECKKRDHRHHHKAIEQAISYADASNIHAEYVIYTNGSHWETRRKLQDRWVPVVDLPNQISVEPNKHLIGTIHTAYQVKPILAKLGDRMEGSDAVDYLERMQEFFHAGNELVKDIDQRLVLATDLCLRSLIHDDVEYRCQKLDGALKDWRNYAKFLGRDPGHYQPVDGGMHFMGEYARIYDDVHELLEGSSDIAAGDVLLLKLDAALLNYGMLRYKKDTHPAITNDIFQTIRELLSFCMTYHFNIRLPDPSESAQMDEVKMYLGNNSD
jgi:hypothetical protein